jgi:hypothetical protein
MSPGCVLQRLGGLEKLLVRSVRGAVEPNNFVVAVMAISPGNLKATYASAMTVVRGREAGGGDSCLLGFFGGCHWRPRCECRCIDILGLGRTMQRAPTRARVPHPMRRSAHQLIFQRLIRSSSNARHHPLYLSNLNFNRTLHHSPFCLLVLIYVLLIEVYLERRDNRTTRSTTRACFVF